MMSSIRWAVRWHRTHRPFRSSTTFSRTQARSCKVCSLKTRCTRSAAGCYRSRLRPSRKRCSTIASSSPCLTTSGTIYASTSKSSKRPWSTKRCTHRSHLPTSSASHSLKACQRRRTESWTSSQSWTSIVSPLSSTRWLSKI